MTELSEVMKQLGDIVYNEVFKPECCKCNTICENKFYEKENITEHEVPRLNGLRGIRRQTNPTYFCEECMRSFIIEVLQQLV